MEPQLALPVTPDKLYKYSHYAMEPKLDGIRCVAYKERNGKVSLTSRGGKDLTEKVPHVVDWLEQMPDWICLDGELGYQLQTEGGCLAPVLNFNLTTRALGSSVSVALDKQANTDGSIQYFVFDAPDGGSPEHLRRKFIESFLADSDYDDSYPVVLVPRMDRFDQDWYDDYVLAGGEGVMLKNPDALYDPGGRHANNWYKLKKFDTVDGVICSVKEGLGKYERRCGALLILTEAEQLFWCAGMDDKWRYFFWRDREAYAGKHVEVKHFGLTAGTPRFPQFLRMRPDLD